MKDELGGKIMTKFVGLRETIYSYSIDHVTEDKKVKGTKKCVFKNYKNCLKASQFDSKIKYLEKNKIIIDSLKKNH